MGDWFMSWTITEYSMALAGFVVLGLWASYLLIKEECGERKR